MRHLPAVLGVALLIGAIYVVQKEFRNLKIADIQPGAGTPSRDGALIFPSLWTFLSYGILTFYDRLGTIYAGQRSATAASPSPRSAPTRCRTISASPPSPAPPCATGCTRTGA